MKKLYFQIYLGVVGSLVLLAVMVGIFFHLQGGDPAKNEMLQTMREVITLALPDPDAPAEQQQAVLDRLANPTLHLSLYSADRRLLAHVGPALSPPGPEADTQDWLKGMEHESALAIRLADGRWLLARHDHPHTPTPLFATLALLALAVAIAAYPMTRRLTKRLEGLKQAVQALGEGDFKTRVPTRGCDEVATLARSFNLAAERIESLLAAHKQLLANASHELRSPLTRIRLALELQAEQPSPELQAGLRRDIAELDQLIEEILLASRLDAMREPIDRSAVELGVLLAEECARSQADCEAAPLTVNGDERLLRRLLRNLLENARRHGGDQVQASIRSDAGQAVIRVCDNGAGIVQEERERIFEPFYRPAGSREKEGSHGLGLSLVRQIAEHHGGSVLCLPGDGRGACFEVRLPLTS